MPTIGGSGFYTLPEAARISKVPRATVDYWAKTGLITPSQSRSRPRLYSFLDLRDLCVAEQLRNKGAKVRAIRAALDYVRKADDIQHLVEAGFGVTDAGELIYQPEDERAIRPDRKGQIFWVDMRKAMDQLGAQADDIVVLHPADRVEINPKVRGGAPVILGTRISTRLIAELADDEGIDQVLSDYPSLTRADVKAAISYEKGLDRRGGRRSAAG